MRRSTVSKGGARMQNTRRKMKNKMRHHRKYSPNISENFCFAILMNHTALCFEPITDCSMISIALGESSSGSNQAVISGSVIPNLPSGRELLPPTLVESNFFPAGFEGDVTRTIGFNLPSQVEAT